MLRRTAAILALSVALCGTAHARASAPAAKPKAPFPPAQPASGPGGSDYAYKDIVATPFGNGRLRYWIFEPAHATAALPVIAFNPASASDNPESYGAWIGHLVRRGNIVIYPLRQTLHQRSSEHATLNAVAAIEAALAELKKPGHDKADTSHFAILGHRAGGVIGANMAAVDSGRRLPPVSALMLVDPGNSLGTPGVGRISPYNSLGAIRRQTLMLVLVGDEDQLVGDTDAKRIFTHAGAARGNKNYVIVHSDRYGMPPLIADQLSAQAAGSPWVRAPKHPAAHRPAHNAYDPRRTDAVDYYAYWKLFDALTDAAFFNRNRDVALGDTAAQRDMGKWSNGQPVLPLTVLTSLPKNSK